MATPAGMSRGAQLLREWRGERLAEDVRGLLGLDPATYSRFENGVRKPVAEIAVRIEKVTDGAVPATSWYERAASDSRAKGKRAS